MTTKVIVLSLVFLFTACKNRDSSDLEAAAKKPAQTNTGPINVTITSAKEPRLFSELKIALMSIKNTVDGGDSEYLVRSDSGDLILKNTRNGVPTYSITFTKTSCQISLATSKTPKKDQSTFSGLLFEGRKIAIGQTVSMASTGGSKSSDPNTMIIGDEKRSHFECTREPVMLNANYECEFFMK